jgi:hypothetical protein
MTQTLMLGELMYEIDALYVSTEMILSRRFREFPLDGMLLEASLLHFRVVWDFFYRFKKRDTDVVAQDYSPKWTPTDPPARLLKIRKWLNVMLAHLTMHRVDPACKAGEITEEDIGLIRDSTRDWFISFWSALTEEQRKALVNPLARKFTGYEILSR